MTGSGQRFKVEDAASYADVVDRYDTFVRRFSPPLVRRALTLGRVSEGQRVLDVGTGSGIVALGAAGTVGLEGSVVGIDLSLEMLKSARGHAIEAFSAGAVDFARMDAEVLAFPNETFDTVLSLFALLHLPDPLAGLREMYRVLRPGGRLVIAVGSRGPLLSPRAWPHFAKRVLDRVRVAAGRQLEAPAFLDRLVAKHCAPRPEPEESALASEGLNRTRRIPQLVRQAGFTRVSTHWDGHRAFLHDPQDFWDMQRAYSSFARKRLEDEVGREVVREEFFSRVERVLARGGRLAYPYGAAFVCGRRQGDPK